MVPSLSGICFPNTAMAPNEQIAIHKIYLNIVFTYTSLTPIFNYSIVPWIGNNRRVVPVSGSSLDPRIRKFHERWRNPCTAAGANPAETDVNEFETKSRPGALLQHATDPAVSIQDCVRRAHQCPASPSLFCTVRGTGLCVSCVVRDAIDTRVAPSQPHTICMPPLTCRVSPVM